MKTLSRTSGVVSDVRESEKIFGGKVMFIHQREPKPRRRPEIVHTPAGLRAGDPVVEGLPLVGDDLGPHCLLDCVPEAIRYPDSP